MTDIICSIGLVGLFILLYKLSPKKVKELPKKDECSFTVKIEKID